MVISNDELQDRVRKLFANRTDDEAIQNLEDFIDTLESFKHEGGEDWKAKFEENDAMWRKKYTDRFYNPLTNTDPGMPYVDPEGQPEDETTVFEETEEELPETIEELLA